MGKRDCSPGLLMRKIVHLRPVARQDDDELVLVVLHRLDQGVDGFFAEVFFAAPGQRIRLVDEQDAAHGFANVFPGALRGVADVLADQIRPLTLDQMTFGQSVHFLEQAAQHPGDGRLARARVALEHHVQRHRFGGELFRARRR